MSRQVDVCIIGCGPIGLTGALLLSRLGIKPLLVERRAERNTHPRSRFVDTNTMELMRELGVEKAVEETGLGPEWTRYNRWFDALTRNEYACIASPTFHTVPRSTSPCLPVMTCQDYVEGVLLEKVAADDNIDLRFHTEVVALSQDAHATHLTLRKLDTNEDEDVTALYTIGADGPGSSTRAVIDSVLQADPRPIHSQDVIFDADLSKYVDDRKASLLYTMPGPGAGVIFQPLDGVRRWRCQVFVPSAELIPEDAVRQRICTAIGTEDDIPITIHSMRMWQPTPGCTSRFSLGRIFLAGDAAHVAIPSGGMGNNSGFTGIRNLAWKLAFVLKGVSPPELLQSYEEEHRPLAQDRIDTGIAIFEAMGPMMLKQLAGQDITEDVHATRIYGNYDGVLLGFELRSGLVAEEPDAPIPVDDPIMDFVPAVRAGRRAPHRWVDDTREVSLLDRFGTSYVLVLGSEVRAANWQREITHLQDSGFPIASTTLPPQPPDSPYRNDGVVLVRPDGIIANHWKDAGDIDPASCLRRILPLA